MLGQNNNSRPPAINDRKSYTGTHALGVTKKNPTGPSAVGNRGAERTESQKHNRREKTETPGDQTADYGTLLPSTGQEGYLQEHAEHSVLYNLMALLSFYSYTGFYFCQAQAALGCIDPNLLRSLSRLPGSRESQ